MELKAFEGQNLEELSLIEVAHEILVQKGDVIEFNELLLMIQEFLKLDESALEQNMVRFYTDLNIDGRFISLGENRWGLRLWYPIDSIDEETITSAEEEAPKRRRKKRKINAFGDDEDMIDYNDDDPEDGESYDEDEDFDEDSDLDDIADVVAAEDLDEDDEDEELEVYASDLSNFDDEIDEDAEFENEDDEEDDEELDEYDDEYEDDEFEDE
ncbi:DNA-directed RNA polymerase subunit delta [Aerococcaceae bacterium zg-ZJ1578]|uniref:DNA-directed RNA polymerase subunit delta n=1 Tax=Aerococcaceae bacterium zg-252 TaxID=2796928 RepID=UPI001A2A2CC0|nr:DNA-directed RNA polymerase subunit delta [Aerococcaceae bacterium zg-1578]